jgi:predicted amidohydrolase
MVGKARRNMPTMDLVVFPEYALHGLSMDTNPEIMCDPRRPRGRRLQAGLHRQRHLGLLLDHGEEPGRHALELRDDHRQ